MNMASIPSKLEKCTGSMLASAIGDALGWPYEFRARNASHVNLSGGDHFVDWTRHTGGKYWNHAEIIRAGEYSDDTQMILAVSRSIISGDWKEHLIGKELPYWLEYERGGGTALKRAAKNYKNKRVPWERDNAQEYFNAGGNGAVMRILPHVIAHSDSMGIERLMEDVINDSILTHGHPRAILGATCYAFALHAIMQKSTMLGFGELISMVAGGISVWGNFREKALPDDWNDARQSLAPYDYFDVWNQHANNMLDKLLLIETSLKKGLLVNDKTILSELSCFDKENGAGDVAIMAALYLASKYANNPILGIKSAAYASGMDTDTVASITGGLLGMLCGTAWIPAEWRLLQDYNCICDIADILCSSNMKESSRRITEKASYNIEWNGLDFQSTPIGKAVVVDKKELLSGKTGKIIITQIRTMLGQTIYVKQRQRINRNILTSADNILQEKRAPVESDIRRAFVLDVDVAQIIVQDPKFSRITFRKVIQIVDMLLSRKRTNQEIANVWNVDVSVVEMIKGLIVESN